MTSLRRLESVIAYGIVLRYLLLLVRLGEKQICRCQRSFNASPRILDRPLPLNISFCASVARRKNNLELPLRCVLLESQGPWRNYRILGFHGQLDGLTDLIQATFAFEAVK